MSAESSQIHLYWATGCTSCLRAKEFLERNDVSFESHNVVEDRAILDDMEDLGLPRQVPVIRRDDDWADAQVLEEVARIAEVEHEAEPLPVDELYRRLDAIIEAVQRHVRAISDEDLETTLPDRPRTVGELVFHLFGFVDSFLEHEDGVAFTSYKPELEWANRSTAALETYGEHVRVRLRDWYERPGQERDWSVTADVYYGDPTVHEHFERTTWHAGQHTRQLAWMLENELDGTAESLDPDVLEGLPMPEKVWDGT